jgi:hypothetical protein
MIIENIFPPDGQHCETTTIGTMLRQLKINLSEPMLFGLGEGLGFYLWDLESMVYPFISGRVRPELISQNLARNLNLNLNVSENTSIDEAWSDVKHLIDNGQIVGLKLDCFFLEYFKRPYHFAEHFVAIYGYDESDAYLVDTTQQGGKVKTSLKSLALARAQKGPMGSSNLHFSFSAKGKDSDLNTAVISAIQNNAKLYLHPDNPVEGNYGINLLSNDIVEWFNRGNEIESGFKSTAKMMEKAGTGGALFRNLYRDFLKESYELLKIIELKNGYESFVQIAQLWNEVSEIFLLIAQNQDIKHVQKASEIIKEIAEKEKKAMELLLNVS